MANCISIGMALPPATSASETGVDMNPLRTVFHGCIPRQWRRWLRRLVSKPTYHGDFGSWSEAKRISHGYAHPSVIEKVVFAARAVRDGYALWERDTVLFYEQSANEPLLRALNYVATTSDGRLALLDFGGALGSTWWQHRPWLANLAHVGWSVVE